MHTPELRGLAAMLQLTTLPRDGITQDFSWFSSGFLPQRTNIHSLSLSFTVTNQNV
jgi:hypothetical protein